MRYIALFIAIALLQAIIIYQFTKKDKYSTFDEAFKISTVLCMGYLVIGLFIGCW